MILFPSKSILIRTLFLYFITSYYLTTHFERQDFEFIVFASMSKIRAIYHGLIASLFIASFYYNANYIKVPFTKELKAFHSIGGTLKFLTVWNMIIQALFFWLCLLNDCIGSNEIKPKTPLAIRKIKDKLFCSIAFPLSVFVATTFWGLYAIDRELVLPKILDLYFPNWLNHIMHTYILIFSLIELVSSYRQYPSRKEGVTTLTFFMLIYLLWMFVIYAKSGEWVYPVLNVLNWPQRIAFFLGLLILVQSFYLMGEVLNKVVWGSQIKKLESGKRQEKKKAH